MTKRIELLKGYGSGLILQGGFLLVFDGIMYLVHHANAEQLLQILEKTAFSYDYLGVTVGF